MSITHSLNIDPLQYVWNIPEFNGDYRDLQVFIDLVDGIQPLIAKYDSPSQTIIYDNIKAKLKGHAREIIEINAQVTDWPQIRKILISNFGVRGTVEELFDELECTRFRTNAAVFYNDVITALHKLNLKTKQTTDPISASSSIESNKKSALTVFKNKMAEPMRSLLYSRNVTSLEEANNVLHECGYAYYCPANSYLYQNPFQHRQSVFPFQHKQSSCFGASATGQNNSNVGIFGGKPLDNSQSLKAFSSSSTGPMNSLGKTNFSFGGTSLSKSESHKVTQPIFKQTSTGEPMELQGMFQGRRDLEANSTENVDQQFPFKSSTQSGQNVQQTSIFGGNTSGEKFY